MVYAVSIAIDASGESHELQQTPAFINTVGFFVSIGSMGELKIVRSLMVVLPLLAAVFNGVTADLAHDFEDPFNNVDNLDGTIEDTYNKALSLGVGIIVAIVIGAIAVVVVVVVLCGCCCYHCCCKSRPSHSTVVVTTPAPQQGAILMQQPVAYEPVNSGPVNSGPDAMPPYPGQQASYGYVKL